MALDPRVRPTAGYRADRGEQTAAPEEDEVTDTLRRPPVAAPPRRQLPYWASWLLCLGLGLGLGWLCRFPLIVSGMTGLMIAMRAGWADASSTLLRDGLSPAVITTVLLWSVFVLAAAPLTALARSYTPVPARVWWPVSVALWVVPYVSSSVGLP